MTQPPYGKRDGMGTTSAPMKCTIAPSVMIPTPSVDTMTDRSDALRRGRIATKYVTTPTIAHDTTALNPATKSPADAVTYPMPAPTARTSGCPRLTIRIEDQ